MKNFILTVVLLSISLFTKAQSIDVYYNYMYANTHIPQGLKIPIYTSNFGYNYNFGEHKWLNYTIGLSYETKGSDYDNWRGYETDRFGYLTCKPMLNIQLPANNIQIGPSLGFLTNIDLKPDDDFSRDMVALARKYELGISIIIQQQMFKYKNMSTHLRVEGNYGLTNYSGYAPIFIRKTGYIRQLTFGIGLGVRWHYKD